ncbi:MAG: GGDEF domain-containing protein [Sneathiella sp.]|nr:GGDEF domain-containing protein [Sneathiella sp.]
MPPHKARLSFEQVTVVTKEKSTLSCVQEIAVQFGMDGVDVASLNAIPEELDGATGAHLMIVEVLENEETALKALIPLLAENNNLQILLIVGESFPEQFDFLVSTGQVDFCQAPVHKDDLQARIEVMNARNLLAEQKIEVSDKDPLTELLTRQAFISRINPIYSSAQRGQVEIAVAIISVEGLDDINRRFGQRVGDRVMKSFAEILSGRLRDTDYLCRYSGRCLALMTVNMRPTHIETYLDDLMLFFLSKGYQAGLVTLEVKAAIGATQELGEDIDNMLSIAEQALEKSRSSGDNVVTIQ